MNHNILWKLDTVCDKLQQVMMHQQVPSGISPTMPKLAEVGTVGLGLKMKQGP